MERQNALLAHLLRREDSDIMKSVSVTDNMQQVAKAWKRVGRPRQKWVDSNAEYDWNSTREEPWEESQEQIDAIINDALQNQF